jgi:S-adenosylmethionine hydrolase
VTIGYAPPSYGDGGATGSITAIDRYGNVATDLDPARLGGIAGLALEIGGVTVARSAESYAEMAGSGELFLIVGSRGTVEVSISGGSAEERLGIGLLGQVRGRRS